jgi:ribose transport system substrate-binding protein
VSASDWSAGRGRVAALAMLGEHPRLRALLCGNDNLAMGAVEAIRASGKTDKVYVTGYNNIEEIDPMIRDGRVLATVEQFAAKQAVFGIDVALKALAENRRQEDLSQFIETPVQLVTKETSKTLRMGAVQA